jgi:hypothetical protein
MFMMVSSVYGWLSLRLGEHMTGSAPRLWDLTGAEIELDGGPTSLRASNVSDADANVRFASKADMCSAKGHVRFTPESGHLQHDTWARHTNKITDQP